MKIVILGGGGGVGSSTAFNVLLRPGDHDLVLVDRREEMVASHAMDLEQVLELGGTGTVRGGDPSEALDADIVVLAAAAPLTVNASRLDYLLTNAEIVEGLLDPIAGSEGWSGTLVAVTNPVDPLCTWIQRRIGIDRFRVLGYTLNDSLRLRTGIARALHVDPGAIDAWVLGEHGDACVPLFDRVFVAGELVTLTSAERAEAEEFLRTWYVRHVALDSGRSSTWTSGVGVAAMIDAIASDSGDVWPVSLVLDGEYGVEGVSLSVPVALGRYGARILEWELSEEQQAGFQRAAGIVRDATDRVEAALASARSRSV